MGEAFSFFDDEPAPPVDWGPDMALAPLDALEFLDWIGPVGKAWVCTIRGCRYPAGADGRGFRARLSLKEHVQMEHVEYADSAGYFVGYLVPAKWFQAERERRQVELEKMFLTKSGSWRKLR